MTDKQKIVLESVGALCVAASAAVYNPILGLFVVGVMMILAANFSGGE